MAELYLVRHGQASFGQENYDQLSKLGERQAFGLGQSMAKSIAPTQLVTGTMARHIQTQASWLEGAQLNKVLGENYSQLELAGFNEFDSEDVIGQSYPELSEHSALKDFLINSQGPKKAFQKVFHKSVVNWIEGKRTGYEESYVEFSNRVILALESLIDNSASGESIVVFTSGGPISTCVQHILGLSAQKGLELNNVMINSSVTRLLYKDKSQVSLSYFNNAQHLDHLNIKSSYR